MKPIHYVILAMLVFLCGCEASSTYSEAEKPNGTVLYRGYDFKITRIEINGVKYLANSKGGIIKE